MKAQRAATKPTSSVRSTPPTSAPRKPGLCSAAAQPSPSTPASFGKLNELETFGRNLKARLAQAMGRPSIAAATSGFSHEATVTRVNGQVVIDTGDGDDKICVTQDPRTGDITVSVNGKSHTFTGDDRKNLVIRAGAGNDVIEVAPGVTVNLRLFGGDGDDVITSGSGHDRIDGGTGNDRINGGAGNDYIYGSDGNDILKGGEGNDTVYGGRGDDRIYGNAGDDYLEGGKGNDVITGGKGNDVVSGGLGDDRLFGGGGDDAIYAGGGKDEICGGSGNNKLYVQADDTLLPASRTGGSNQVVTVELVGNPGSLGVVVEGSEEFVERVMDDLEMLRSSPVGRQMLASFDVAQQRKGVRVTIREYTGNNGYAQASHPFVYLGLNPFTGRGWSSSTTISYNPTYAPTWGFFDFSSAYTPPIVILYHEMAHAYDYANGTLRPGTYQGSDKDDHGMNNLERVAVGLPMDHDNDPTTPEQLDNVNHPYALTENGIREEMNLQLRKSYLLARISGV